jgi:uncharacterized protein (DUF58 family)
MESESMARRRQMWLCSEGFYYLLVVLAVLIGATIRQLNLLILLGAVLAGPLVFSLMYGRLALRRFRVERKLPQQLRADQRLTVEVQFTNVRRWLRIWSIAVEDRVVREDEAGAADAPAKVGVFFPTVGGRETVRSAYYGQLPRRGRYRFGPLRVSTRFPLGLVRHSVTIEDTRTLVVHPKLGRLSHDWTQVVRQAATTGQTVKHRSSRDAEYYGLRDWRAGDNRRWIHWRTSARRGALVVRQFEERRSRDLAVLVDLWQPPDPTDAQRENVERAISFVATLIAEGCRQSGRRLFLSLAASTFLERSGPASPLFFRQQMDELALVAPHHDEHVPPALGHALALVPPSIPTLLVSTRAIDWDALHAAAAQRDARLAGRLLQSVDTSSDELSRYLQD